MKYKSQQKNWETKMRKCWLWKKESKYCGPLCGVGENAELHLAFKMHTNEMIYDAIFLIFSVGSMKFIWDSLCRVYWMGKQWLRERSAKVFSSQPTTKERIKFQFTFVFEDCRYIIDCWLFHQIYYVALIRLISGFVFKFISWSSTEIVFKNEEIFFLLFQCFKFNVRNILK